MIRAGKLNQLVRIQNPDLVDDSSGGGKKPNPAGDGSGWKDSGPKVWAGIDEFSARERLAAGQQQSGLTHKVRLRFTDEVNARSRILFGTILGGRKLYVVGPPINHGQKNRELLLTCEERVD